MVDLEKIISDNLHGLEEDGTIDKIVRAGVEKAVNDIVADLFSWKSPARDLIRKKLEEAFVPAIEERKWDEYIPKLDGILTEILNMENLQTRKKILENFKELASPVPKLAESVSLDEVFEKYKAYAAEDVDTGELEVDETDERPAYQYIDVKAWFEVSDRKSFWNDKTRYGILHFECEQDENLDREIQLENYNNTCWRIEERFDCEIRSLQNMDTFSIYILRLKQEMTKIDVEDGQEANDEVEPDAEPEPTYS